MIQVVSGEDMKLSLSQSVADCLRSARGTLGLDDGRVEVSIIVGE